MAESAKETLSDNELAELLKAANDATPGPWDFHGLTMSYHIAQVDGSRHRSPRVVHATLGKSVYDADNVEHGAGGVRKYADAQFIALANPLTVRKVVEELIRARGRTDDYKPAKAVTKESQRHPFELTLDVVCNPCGSLIGAEWVVRDEAPKEAILCVDKCRKT